MEVEQGSPWRSDQELPPASVLISSPYDGEARYSTKRTTSWTGYKVHFTETCDEDEPHLLTQVTATAATTADGDVVENIHMELAAYDLLPQEHLVDTGYVDAEVLVESRERHQVDLLGPVPPDGRGPAQEPERLDLTHFDIAWTSQTARCPAGCMSRRWGLSTDRHGKAVLRIKFAPADCRDCLLRPQWTRSQARVLSLRPTEQAYHALQEARQRQQTPEFRKCYAKRAGVEGTIAQSVRICDMRQARYLGLRKLKLQAHLTATAIHLIRACDWLAEETHASTPTSRFAKLVASAQ